MRTNVEILNSGSFVPLDNREKIEQLIFTAKTLATELSRTEGFQGSGPTNHQLGLEMWKGAEYMCRAHEEANIRNLFLSKFLETLREVERQTVAQPRPTQSQIVNSQMLRPPELVPVSVQLPSTQIVAEQRPQATAEDEYLGVVPQDSGIETEKRSYADECMPECEAEIAAMSEDAERGELVKTFTEKSREDETNDLTPLEVQRADEPVVKDTREPQAAEINASDATDESASEEPDAAQSPGTGSSAAIGSIVLAEKEPYNFDSCTVTAVIQLLPGNGGIRKCVISVRSHDFGPQISVSELTVADINADANRLLTEAIGRYRTELPALAAEKIKKEKPATKKRSAKTNNKSATASSATAETLSIPPPAAQISEAAKDQRNLFAS